jgi:hypothetical protein
VSALPAADGVVGVTVPDVELLAQRYKGRTGIRQAEATLGLADEGARHMGVPNVDYRYAKRGRGVAEVHARRSITAAR